MTQKSLQSHAKQKEATYFYEKQNYKTNGTSSHLLFTAKTKEEEIEPLLTVIAFQPASSSESLQRTLHQSAAA